MIHDLLACAFAGKQWPLAGGEWPPNRPRSHPPDLAAGPKARSPSKRFGSPVGYTGPLHGVPFMRPGPWRRPRAQPLACSCGGQPAGWA